MPRAPRPRIAGGVYHVTIRGVRKTALFRDGKDRRAFLWLLGLTVERMSWACLSYNLLTTHLHLLVRTPLANISEGMQLLNGRYGARFNSRHGTEGHVFERRFAARVVETEDHLFEAARYIDLNAVRAGSCVLPEDWPWGSYRATIGLVRVPRFLSVEIRERFGGPRHGAAAYERYVLDGLPAPDPSWAPLI